jgi:methionine-rich copper-binding protein CopC
MRTLRLLVTTLAAFAAQSVLAHTELTSTVPADRATLAAAPEHIELKFSEPVRLTALTIQLGDAAKQSIGPLPSGNSETFSVALPAGLGEGHYAVTWRVLSEDTHVVSGELMFAVGPAAGPDAHAGHDPATAPAEPATPVPAAHDEHGGAH